jgi:hypothetical protein
VALLIIRTKFLDGGGFGSSVSQAFPNEISNGVEIKYVDRRTVSFTKKAQLSVTSDEKAGTGEVFGHWNGIHLDVFGWVGREPDCDFNAAAASI